MHDQLRSVGRPVGPGAPRFVGALRRGTFHEVQVPPSIATFFERFGEAVASVLLALVYFAVLGPLALLRRPFTDPLVLRAPHPMNATGTSAWRPWPAERNVSGAAALARARRQS